MAVAASSLSRKSKRVLSAVVESMEPRRMFSTTYYVSPTGSDNNNGTSTSSPWQTVAKVNATTFQPGDSILFQTGAQFHDALSASSSGTAGAPITFGSYGDSSLPNPEFFGSDPIDASAFTLVTGTTYSAPETTLLNWVYDNHAFTHESQDALTQAGSTSASDETTNINYVEANSETFYYDATSSTLYVNVGAALTGHTITTATRASEIESNAQSYITFKDIDATECAADNNTYGFSIQGGSNVQLIDCNAFLTGKHAFGAINTTDFLGQGLVANGTAPDLGFGGASAFVSYSDATRSGDTYQWINDTYLNPNGAYGVFVTHGDATNAIASILLKNMVSENGYGSGIFCETTGPDEVITVEGGELGGASSIDTDNSIVDGVKLDQSTASMELDGNNDVVQNCVFTNLQPDVSSGHNGAVVLTGTGDVARFNTFSFAGSAYGPAVDIKNATSDAAVYGNIFDCPLGILLYFTGTGEQTSDNNLFDTQTGFGNFTGAAYTAYTLADWQAMGLDKDSVVGNPGFVDASTDNFALTGTSPAIDLYTGALTGTTDAITTDYLGNPRPFGAGYDAGAYEYQSVKTPITGSISVSDISVAAPLTGTSTVASFTVALSAAQTVAETVQYTTTDGTALAGTDYTAATGTLTFAPGVTSQTVDVTVTPTLAANSSSAFQLTLSDPSVGIALATSAATATLTNVGETTTAFTRKTPLTYTDSGGRKVTLRLAGVGNGSALFESGDADPVQISLTGTTAASSLTLQSPRGATTLHDITVQGPLGVFTAAANLTGSMSFISTVRGVSLDNVSSPGTISFASAAARPAIRLAAVDGADLTSAGPIASLIATSWTAGSSSTITAPAISSLSVRGAFAPNLTITGAVTAARVGSITGGTWNIGGATGAVTATSVTGWTGTFSGGIKSLAIAGSLSAALTASSIHAFTVRGSVTNSTISLTTAGAVSDLAVFTVGGSITDSSVLSQGNIGSITAGAAVGSTFFAGVSSGLTTLPTAATDFTGSNTITSFTVTAPRALPTGFSNTLVAAANIGRGKVKGVQTANNGVPFGFASESLASFGNTETGAKPFNWTSKQSTSLLSFAGDFKVSVI